LQHFTEEMGACHTESCWLHTLAINESEQALALPLSPPKWEAFAGAISHSVVDSAPGGGAIVVGLN